MDPVRRPQAGSGVYPAHREAVRLPAEAYLDVLRLGKEPADIQAASREGTQCSYETPSVHHMPEATEPESQFEQRTGVGWLARPSPGFLW